MTGPQHPGDEANDRDAPATASGPVYPMVEQWCTRWLFVVFARKLSSTAGRGQVLCPQWWDHPEVVVRFTSLWTAWEKASASEDGDALSGWFTHHADPQLRTLLDAEHGPMHQCDREHHKTTRPLARYVLDPPPGWFD